MKLSSLTLLLASVPALAAFTTPACARWAEPATTMQVHGQLLDLAVYDRDSRETLPVYRQAGRYYVAGVPGHRYQLSLRNQSSEAVLGIVSVDGINAISGSTADWSQGDGYVLSAGSTYDVKGWRKSQSQVAGFVFADTDSSYAARTGRPDNVGVVGIAVFRSRAAIEVMARDEVARTEPEARMSMQAAPPIEPSFGTAAPAPSLAARESSLARADKASTPLGTGFGQRERDEVHDVDFQRASSAPNEVITLYYDTRAHLVARGVLPPLNLSPQRPEPFPNRFVPDPPMGDSR
ncbi:MAG: hypothetical protein ABI227_10105 [Rhodanobacter sp.]